MTAVVRELVSKKKKRFKQDGYDLDLTYVIPQVIAMGYPSVGFEATYRNPLPDVQRFLNTRHTGKYKVYNLCCERDYDIKACFYEGCDLYRFADHQACPFAMIPAFCLDVHRWLADDPERIAAIHCKAGKGRTGLLICCYLVFNELFPNAYQALLFYGDRRTKNNRGVTIPSQIRYVHYFERYMRFLRNHTNVPVPAPLRRLLPEGEGEVKENPPKPGKPVKWVFGQGLNPIESKLRDVPLPPTAEWVALRSIRVEPLPILLSAPNAEFTFKLINHRPDDTQYRTSSKELKLNARKDLDDGYLEWSFVDPKDPTKSILPLLQGDIHFIVQMPGKLGKSEKVFQCWVNTQFLDRKPLEGGPVPPSATGNDVPKGPFPDFYASTNIVFFAHAEGKDLGDKGPGGKVTYPLAAPGTTPVPEQCFRLGTARADLNKSSLDTACKDAKGGKHKKYPPGLKMTMLFDTFRLPDAVPIYDEKKGLERKELKQEAKQPASAAVTVPASPLASTIASPRPPALSPVFHVEAGQNGFVDGSPKG